MRAQRTQLGETVKIVDDDGRTLAVRVEGTWESPDGELVEEATFALYDDLVTVLEETSDEVDHGFGKFMAGTLVGEARRRRIVAAPVERESSGQRRARLIGDTPANRTRIR